LRGPYVATRCNLLSPTCCDESEWWRSMRNLISRRTSSQAITPERSALMGRVRHKDTTPEIAVRKSAHSLGFRFRLQRRDLPGTPDLVFPRLRKIVFVHGCFWHRHKGCARTTTPKTRREFWQEKFFQNIRRDKAVKNSLRSKGWDVLVVWECETLEECDLRARLYKFLGQKPTKLRCT
jgi:DNA mismatch endonuclease, patch repair protein